MDNVCHTLVGAALAESGLKRRTALGSATLMIAANFPDVDVIAVPLGHSLGFRRGITHGVPAMVLLPVVLTLAVLAWHRWRGRGGAPDARWLLVLSAIGIATHPFLDWMNTYGMRWLMPLRPTWWYADTLFIVDPWIWLAAGLGVWWSRRLASRQHATATTPARTSLVLVGAYIAAMGGVTAAARDGVRDALNSRGIMADTVVVDPVLANPVRRRVIYHWEGAYHLASYDVLARELSAPWFAIPLNEAHPAVPAANRTPQGREYHSWTRLPYYVIEETRDTAWVTIADARYTLDGRSSWAVTRIPVPATQAVAGGCATASPAFRRTPCE
jgi:inner membrane protein